MAASANPGQLFTPVPTAVPPRVSSNTFSSAARIRLPSSSSIEAYPENSCPSVKGVAS
jgi:hypothetical protein